MLAVLFAVLAWTQFRVDATNNAVLPGTLSTTWKVVTGGPISASPAYVDGILYVGNNNGYLYAIEAATGRTLWVRHVNNPIMTAPLVYDDVVIVGEGNEQSVGGTPTLPLFVGTGESAMLGFDRRTGVLRWRTAMSGSAMPTGAIIDGAFVHHNGAGWVASFDPATGVRKYSKFLHSVASMSAVLPIGNGTFITNGVMDNAVFAVRASDGKMLWKTLMPAVGSGIGDCPPVSDGKNVYCNYMMPVPPDQYTIATRPATQHMYALDVATGAKRWDINLESGVLAPRNEASIPLLAQNTLFFGNAVAPWMHALDPASGRLLWRSVTRAPVKGGLVYADGAVYFGDLKGYLWALDAKTGAVIGVKKMPSGFNVGSPILVGRTLVIGSRTGTVYAVPIDAIRSSKDS